MPEYKDMNAGSSSASSVDSIVSEIRKACPRDKRIVFVSGNFNVVHPGHMRLLNFAAECGDFLVVGVSADGDDKTIVKQDLRLESIKSISVVDYAFLIEVPVEQFLERLRPNFVVKGREHAQLKNAEEPVLASYGGKLLFSSGDIRFSSIDLLHRELLIDRRHSFVRAQEYPKRHGFELLDLERYVDAMSSLNVVVVGDLIVDRYITCQALGMSQEEPTIVVTPLAEDLFVGGGGIVAAHTRQLGAKTTFISVCGNDDTGQFARRKLEEYDVDLHLLTDETRPTTLKDRYRTEGRSLLRVNKLRQHEISREIADAMLAKIESMSGEVDVLIFSDFSYGCLPQKLVDSAIDICRANGVFMSADSQVSSQAGDVSRFKAMNLITPTELEARTACQDFSSGLVILARKLQELARTSNVIVTLGSEGLLVQTAPTGSDAQITDRLPAFNRRPAGVSGAGDSLLACASLSMASGASVWEAAYLGAVGAACQVSREGNIPLTPDELIDGLSR